MEKLGQARHRLEEGNMTAFPTRTAAQSRRESAIGCGQPDEGESLPRLLQLPTSPLRVD